jgi:hypothetical protein
VCVCSELETGSRLGSVVVLSSIAICKLKLQSKLSDLTVEQIVKYFVPLLVYPCYFVPQEPLLFLLSLSLRFFFR